MKNILFITLILIISSSNAANTVVSESMPKFTNSLYLGIATNKSTIIVVGERGHIALSSDYGSTWQQAKNVPTRTTLTAVSMFQQHVWAVGHDTTILYSSDAGTTWELQFEDKERQMPLLDVMFINESDGFAIGAYGTYLTTHDGGENWNDSLISHEQDYHLNKIISIDEFKYFVVAEAGNAYKSLDAGKTWNYVELPYSGSMFGAVYYDEQLILYGLRGNVLVSDDFGETFIQIESPILDSLFGSEHTYSNKLLMVGANGAVLQYKNNKLKKIKIPNSDGDYTGLLSVKDDRLVFMGESGISTKQLR